MVNTQFTIKPHRDTGAGTLAHEADLVLVEDAFGEKAHLMQETRRAQLFAKVPKLFWQGNENQKAQNSQAHGKPERYTHRCTDTQADIQTGRQTHTHTQTDRHTHTHRHTQIHTEKCRKVGI